MGKSLNNLQGRSLTHLLHNPFRLEPPNELQDSLKGGYHSAGGCQPSEYLEEPRVSITSGPLACLDLGEVFFLLALETGMREGELLGLRWSDIDLSRGLIRVQKTLNWKVKPPVLQDVKTDGSYRVVPAGTQAMAALNDFLSLTQQERTFFPAEYTDQWRDLVFKSRYGTPIEPSNLTKTFKNLLAKAGLPRTIRIHDMRHTSATLGLNSGVDLKTVSDRLGHSGIGITADLYTHVNLSRQKDATKRIGSLLFRAGGDQSEDRSGK